MKEGLAGMSDGAGTARTIVAGGILAAGEGSRLRQDGWTVPKPLVPVAGVPLVQHTIDAFLSAGIAPLAILFNESEQDCVAFVRARFSRRDLSVHVRTTASSFESFQYLSARLPEGPALFSTVDAWCTPRDFVRFVRRAAAARDEVSVLAVTRFAEGNDERPLWVRRDGAGVVREIGSAEGDAVTAGVYLFSQRARELAAGSQYERLRAFLTGLVALGEPVEAVEIEEVVDVDRGRDVAQAEDLAVREGDPGSLSRERTR